MKLNLLIISLAPTLALLMWIYIKDKYDREPIKVLIRLFFIGTLISIPAIAIEDILLRVNINNSYLNLIYTSFIVAATTEEVLKAMVLISYTLKSRYYTEKLDGIVYSICITLGFATIENIIYIFNGNYLNVFQIGLARAVISIPAHVLFAINMGYYLSMYKFNLDELKSRRMFLVKLILIPIILHGLFDILAMIKTTWASIVFIVYLVYLWKISLDKLDEYTDYARRRFFRLKRKKNKNKK
ncbi:PrsW family glutamic-type intramembrane protease [Paraclostridium ghonii]|uniref:PrsW family intramembrane metalloprotease n=1 Tax=Paraclostridium ghonii TaxID=29358 RepID=UPI00202CC903|nr:PrsW family glutamic-type intramembrane protease [Paeniclostridium ghonii]MCM0165772.1 PrsW family glutamic-type intramembrane protease [Paeniclostridium ghonii]